MNFILIMAGYLSILSADETLGLALKSVLSDANVVRDIDSSYHNNGEFPVRPHHRFRLPEPNTDAVVVDREPKEPLSENSVQESENISFLGEGYYPYSGMKDSGTRDNDGHKVILRADKRSLEERDASDMWEKTNLKVSLWKSYLIRSHNHNRNVYEHNDENKSSNLKTASSLESKPVSDQYVDERKNNENKNFKKYSNSNKEHIPLENKKILGLDVNNFHKSDQNEVKKLLIDSTSEMEPLKYSTQIPKELVNKVEFTENEIISKVYSMIESVDKIPHYYDANVKSLPEAQRRYAKGSLANDEIYSKELSKKNMGSQRIRFTTVMVGTLMSFLILVLMVLALRVHCHNREKSSQEWIRHPVVQPVTATSDAIQPNFQHILHTDHLHTEPIRIKTKGLLERRGSNTSLTIDLGPGNEGTDVVFTLSRECTPEHFLMTAGNRMSRRQLRLCLKDPRDLHTEFWQIPTNHPDKCGVPGAAAKNRYRTVLPNENTRVVLHRAPPDSPETPASQYINANYVRGYDGEERAYIATQGPLAHTVEDLWLLVVQERSSAVVMITRLKEKGRVKCEPYIPSYSASYGSIQVTVKQVTQRNGYTIRHIYLKRGDEVHTTLHFWFTSWPDHKTPTSARHLLAMAAEVETARKENGGGPIIVHCSAGIGRTGCFIAVSIGKNQLIEEDCVDILTIVCQMRLDRGGMVQTAEQYEFIHRALALSEASLPSSSSCN